MAGSQQQQIIDTIFSMKRRILQPDDSSDSEETEIPYSTQRQSLKRKAHYTRSGDPEFLSDERPYKKKIEHAGYRRRILQRNPPRYDPDGDVVEIGDEYEDEDDLSTVEENPYADIQLENLLAPLTSPADLPNHPSYSIPYTSKHLTNMTKEAAAISRKEQISLWHSKRLFNKLQGDSGFAPQALASLAREPLQDFWSNGANGKTANEESEPTSSIPNQTATAAEIMVNGVPDVEMADAGQTNGTPAQEDHNGSSTTEAPDGAELVTNGASHDPDAEKAQTNGERASSLAGDDTSETASQQTAHRMTTRARAHAASTPSPPSSPSSAINSVHPLFTFSTDSLPDRDFGLPPSEAEETRMLLMAYVQKQEEVSRIATELYHGMMQGERMRQDVFKWSKAEGHVGEMSDGEDWYDREEWGLESGLIKGRDEEEDDTAVAGKKSTRQRRKPDKEDR